MPSTSQCHQFAASGACAYGDTCRFQHGPTTRRLPKRRTRGVHNSSASNHLEDFFSEFDPFAYDPTRPATEEFHRLGRFYGWGRDSYERKDAHERFKDAMVQEFNYIYGTDEHNIDNWHGLCRVLNISPIPETLEACKEKVKETHVNLVDLVDLPNSRRTLVIFPTQLELSEYSKEYHKIFPKENAYAGGLLRFLLRQIANPPQEVSHSNRRRRRR